MERVIRPGQYYGSRKGMLAKYDRLARKDAFTGASAEEFEQWGKQARKTLGKLLGLENMEKCPLEPKVLERVEAAEGILREKVLLQVEPEVYMPVYILIPEKKQEEKQGMKNEQIRHGSRKVQCGGLHGDSRGAGGHRTFSL